MKKIIIVAAMMLGFSIAASAQPRAVGLHGSLGVGLSYQHTLGENFVEAEVGFAKKSFSATGVYNWTLLEPAWTNKGEWGVYAGPAATVGFFKGGALLGVGGRVGLEYTFWFPLQLSVDLTPQLNATMAKGGGLTFGGYIPSLGVRYRF